MIALLVVTDGRLDCLERAVASALANLDGPVTRRVMYDDTGDPDHQALLQSRFPTFEHWHPDTRQGFGGAIRHCWQRLRDLPERFVFHLEDDFTFNHPVPLDRMAGVLDSTPRLVQLALRRQPWNEQERAAGGVVEQHPGAYLDVASPIGEWLEHRLFFTTNPSLYRRSLCTHEWPEGANTEGRFTHELLADPNVRFGFWGSRESGEWVTHIGAERNGTGY